MKFEAQVELSHMRSYVGLYCKSNPDASGQSGQYDTINITMGFIPVIYMNRDIIIILFSYLFVFLVPLHPLQLVASLAFWVLLHLRQQLAF